MPNAASNSLKDRLAGAGITLLLLLALFVTIRFIGTNANVVYSQVGSAIQSEESLAERLPPAKMDLFSTSDTASADSTRRIAHTSSFDLIVSKPAQAALEIRALAEKLGGYLVTSEISGSESGFANLTVRVPVARAEEAKAAIRKLAIRVESEKQEAEDVTKQWVDTDARLRNLRATEQQYLQILKRATTVKDTLEVSEKLSEVRGEIEQQQAEFAVLTKRVETVAITVRLTADADVAVFGFHWRPLYRAKLAVRNAIDALGDYAATMFEVIVHIPVIILWLVTVVAGAAVGWRFLRWAGRVFFGWKR